MVFDTTVALIPCQCLVYEYLPAVPMRVTGTGFGDAEPPEDEIFDFRILDRTGHPAKWLERKLTKDDHQRLLEEYLS